MTPPKDGGPAFPLQGDGAYLPNCETADEAPAREFPRNEGMSLRDWFAGQALAGAISNARFQMALADVADRRGIEPTESVARAAYTLADAMLAVRAKTGGAA